MSTHCVLCARNDRITELDAGHCCQHCQHRIDADLASIVTNADLAAIGTIRQGNGGARGVYESKPPIDLDQVNPYAVLVNVTPGTKPSVAVALWDVLSQWERLIREERGFASYGDATAHHTGTEAALQAQAARQAVSVLRANLEWATSEPTFPLEDFAAEIRQCAHTIRVRVEAPERGQLVICPTILDDGEQCGARLTISIWAAVEGDSDLGEPVTCKRCRVTRRPEQLIAAGSEDTYVDAEALAKWFAVGERTLRRWAEDGKVRRRSGLYSWTDTRAMVLARHAKQSSA